ncbi:hypothetical protein RRG08_066334 [Elysia crispata]|uniref:Uncharacterized protein n=1 Tax=Elysia crispata TaxID=231223 RepID=A0AAE1DX64_9GAST|nr:hypothetical protein RRG08_066334 [Elysia crispata]
MIRFVLNNTVQTLLSGSHFMCPGLAMTEQPDMKASSHDDSRSLEPEFLNRLGSRLIYQGRNGTVEFNSSRLLAGVTLWCRGTILTPKLRSSLDDTQVSAAHTDHTTRRWGMRSDLAMCMTFTSPVTHLCDAGSGSGLLTQTTPLDGGA